MAHSSWDPSVRHGTGGEIQGWNRYQWAIRAYDILPYGPGMFTTRTTTGMPMRPNGRRTTRGQRGQRGQSLVEFAMVLPLFLLILAAIVDFGMGLASSITISNAAREGARLGIVDPDPSAIETRVRAVASGLDGAELTVTSTCLTPSGSSWVACGGTPWQPGDSMIVRADYDYHIIWPLFFGTVIPLSSSVEMRVE
jgi:hypothetical protein